MWPRAAMAVSIFLVSLGILGRSIAAVNEGEPHTGFRIVGERHCGEARFMRVSQIIPKTYKAVDPQMYLLGQEIFSNLAFDRHHFLLVEARSIRQEHGAWGYFINAVVFGLDGQDFRESRLNTVTVKFGRSSAVIYDRIMYDYSFRQFGQIYRFTLDRLGFKVSDHDNRQFGLRSAFRLERCSVTNPTPADLRDMRNGVHVTLARYEGKAIKSTGKREARRWAILA